MRYKLSEIAAICAGRLVGEDSIVTGVLTDSRRSSGGEFELFVAMEGVNHDSHLYIEQMIRRGVRSFLVENERYICDGASFVVVENSLDALQCLAKYHRQQFKGCVVGITGSNGKTVVKEWIAQVMSPSVKLFRSPKSYNSQLGVALSLLMIEGDESVALIEAGISRVGEMEKLESMIRPNVVIITSIGEAHQEGFTSLNEKIEEKLILAREAATIIYNSCYTPLSERLSSCGVCAGVIDASCYNGAIGVISKDLAVRSNTQIIEAFMCVMGYGAPDFSCLQSVAMRLEVKEGLNDSIVINDSYNSDINSLSIALDFLNSVAADRKKVLIISPSLQSGIPQSELYQRVAKIVNRAGIDKLIGVGYEVEQFASLFTPQTEFYPTTEALLRQLNSSDYANRAILIKGNRESRFERISHAIERKSHTTRLEVDLDAMRANLNYFRSKLKHGVRLTAMVKASSYGAGEADVAQMLQYEGVDYLAVAFADEGVALRERGITMPIIVLNADDGSFEQMIQMRLEPEIYSLHSLRSFVDVLERHGETNYSIHIKLDTGMHRLGFTNDQIGELINELAKIEKRVRIASIFSHLSCADVESERDFTRGQIALFDSMSGQIMEVLSNKPLRHISASAAIDTLSDAQFDMCRLGIGLYGFGMGEALQPVSTLKSRIVQIKSLKAGESVGYGRASKLERDSRIATIPIGYADGMDRHLGCGRWSLLVGEQPAPILGRICMDSLMVDITDIDNVAEGDDVVIFSSKPGNTAQDMAEILDTISYEVLTSVSKRVKRVYLKGEF